MHNILEKGDFLSFFGLQGVWNYLKSSDLSEHTTVSTNLDNGSIRALLLRAKNKPNGNVKVSLKYLYHKGTAKNDVVTFLTMTCREENGNVDIKSAKVLGNKLNVQDGNIVSALSNIIKKFSNSVTKSNEWLNPIQLLEESGLNEPGVGKKIWPGLYATGDFKNATNNNSIDSQKEPVFPALFLHSILGVGPDQYTQDNFNSRALTLHEEGKNAKSSLLKYTYKRGKKRNHLDIEGTVTLHGAEKATAVPFYKIKVRPVKEKKKQAQIKSLEYMGRKIDLTDTRAVSSIIKVIRDVNRTIRAGDEALIEDLKKRPHERRLGLPTELMLHMNVYPYLNDKIKIPNKGLMTFTAIGGNNSTPYVSDADTNIGANQYIIGYEHLDEKGKKNSEALMIDAGVLFHDVFDAAFFNAGRYLHHKHDKGHVPDQPVNAILFTHRHKDHLGQLAYLIKCKYQLPPLIMNEMTMLQLKRDMSELNIDKDIREEILAQCYPINMVKDINPSAPGARKVTTINGGKIEQWTEELPGEKLGQTHYYPRLKIGSMNIRIGPMPHSDPGFMFNIITPVGSHVHTGDYKLSDDEMLGAPPLRAWLEACEADSLSADSTGATKEGHNPSEKDVEENIYQEFIENPDANQIHVMLGSNIARLETEIRAAGRAGKKGIILDGKAVEDLARDADKAHGLKAWAKRKYEMEILFRSYKKAGTNLYNPDYVKIITGTQDEEFSTANRLLRDWLPPDRLTLSKDDRIVFLQGVIPVGDNAKKRYALVKPTERFHGVTVILPEIVEKEADIILHSSGHNCREDMKGMIQRLTLPFVVPVHGGPDQLQAHAKLAEEVGAESIIAPGSMTLRIQKGKKVTPLRIEQSDLIGIRLHTPSKEKFFLKGRFSTSVIPIKPALDTPSALLVDVFERMARNAANVNSKYEAANTQPISLSPTFNAVVSNGFLRHRIPFGVDKVKGSVFEAKNIHAIGTFDTETGGLDANRYLIRELGLSVEDVDGNELETTQLYQKIPDYRFPSPKALLVTNTDPNTLKEGLDTHLFVDAMQQSIKDLKAFSVEIAQTKEPDAGHNATNVFSLSVAHNSKFDGRFIGKEMARNLDMNTRPHQTNKVICVDTRAISRAMVAYTPKEYKVRRNSESGFYDHTLEGLCAANRIQYDTSQSHGALYDTRPCKALFKKQREIAPEIVEQMIINAASSSSQLLNDMMGMETGFGGPHPVFSYVSHSALHPKPQMGCFVGTMNSERYAVVFNLKYDPNDYLHKPISEIVELMSDPKSDVFEVLDLRQNPIVMPARFGLRLKAAGNIPKETLDSRAGIVRRNINYVDPKADCKNISQKIDDTWQWKREKAFSSRFVPDYPDTEAPMPEYDNAPTPEDGAISMQRMNAKKFNPVYRELHKDIREYLKSIRSEKYAEASRHYKAAMKILKNPRAREDFKDVILTINNVHYDIRPKDLRKEDINHVKCMRAYLAFVNYHKAADALENIEENPDEYKRYVGDDKDKQALFETIKQWIKDNQKFSKLTPEVRQFVRWWLSVTDGRTHDNNHEPQPIAA